MKIREGFVSNSSSSSFVIVSAGNVEIFEAGDVEMIEELECNAAYFPIDDIIDKLLKAKANGATKVSVTHGGGYEG